LNAIIFFIVDTISKLVGTGYSNFLQAIFLKNLTRGY